MKSIEDFFPELVERLSEVSQTPRLDAQVLLAHAMQKTRTWVLAHPEAMLSDLETASVTGALARLTEGEPLPYVLGEWEFFGLRFQINPAVLIPRPETELLVEKGLAWLHTHPGQHLAADVGTGSGCIAIALAKNHLGLRVIASDISPTALGVTQANIKGHNLHTRVQCVQSDLIPPTTHRFSLICANLPYIPARTLKRLKVLRWEPELALRGGPDGLDLIRRLITQAPRSMGAHSLLLLEIEARQGERVFQLVSDTFPNAKIDLSPDLAGHDRLVTVELSSNSQT